MSTFKIEKGVKMPKGGHRRATYPFGEMKVGDSFFVPGKTSNDLCNAIRYRKERGLRGVFTVRKEDGGVRVWRIE